MSIEYDIFAECCIDDCGSGIKLKLEGQSETETMVVLPTMFQAPRLLYFLLHYAFGPTSPFSVLHRKGGIGADVSRCWMRNSAQP